MSPYPNSADTGQLFRKTAEQQAVEDPNVRFDSLANIMMAAGGDFNKLTEGMGDLQMQGQQAQMFDNPDIPTHVKGQLAYGHNPGNRYSVNTNGQGLDQYTGNLYGGHLLDANINKLNRIDTKKDALKNLPSEIEKLFYMPALDNSGQPLSDPFTGKQGTNLDQDLMTDFILFRNQNRIADPYQAYAMWKASKQAAPAPVAPAPAEKPEESGIISSIMNAIAGDSQAAPQQAPIQQQAPPQAVQMLMANPQMAEAFKAKYGYLPEGP